MSYKGSILIVDDQPNNLELLFSYLQVANPNFRILKAPNGALACKIAQQKHPNLIIMDWEMPVMNGIEAVKLLQQSENTRRIPIIMATGVMTSTEHLRQALEAGAIDYIRKPIDKIELLARVNSALKLSGAYQQILAQKNEIETAYSSLKNMQTRLVHSEKMASLIQLTEGIVHEINNPITFITAGKEIIEESLPPLIKLIETYSELDTINSQEDHQLIKKVLEKVKRIKEDVQFEIFNNEVLESIKAIQEGTSRTLEVINKLRSFSRVNENINLNDIHIGLDATLTLLNHKLPKSVVITKDYDTTTPLIECYEGLLNQAFMNILLNAIRAVGDSGQILIKTEYLPENENVQVLIQDTGVGIPAHTLPRVFEPFFTTQNVGEGVGLGLSIAHSIISKHRGTIAIKSESGQGTSVTITLPQIQHYKNLSSK